MADAFQLDAFYDAAFQCGWTAGNSTSETWTNQTSTSETWSDQTSTAENWTPINITDS